MLPAGSRSSAGSATCATGQGATDRCSRWWSFRRKTSSRGTAKANSRSGAGPSAALPSGSPAWTSRPPSSPRGARATSSGIFSIRALGGAGWPPRRPPGPWRPSCWLRRREMRRLETERPGLALERVAQLGEPCLAARLPREVAHLVRIGAQVEELRPLGVTWIEDELRVHVAERELRRYLEGRLRGVLVEEGPPPRDLLAAEQR